MQLPHLTKPANGNSEKDDVPAAMMDSGRFRFFLPGKNPSFSTLTSEKICFPVAGEANALISGVVKSRPMEFHGKIHNFHCTANEREPAAPKKGDANDSFGSHRRAPVVLSVKVLTRDVRNLEHSQRQHFKGA